MAAGEDGGDPGYDGSNITGFVSPASDALEDPVGRTHIRLAWPLAVSVQGLRAPARGVRSHGHPCHDPPDDPSSRSPKP